jgi:hypothetical protein
MTSYFGPRLISKSRCIRASSSTIRILGFINPQEFHHRATEHTEKNQ